jgi:hypothetical protein
VPVVRLKKEHYTHKSYGRIFTPVFDITAWVSLDGQADEQSVSEAPVETPTRRRRSA